MTIAEKRWAQLAQEAQFHQLATARKQAEGWRTGLAGLTALLGAVLIVKGRSDIGDLRPGVRYLVVVLLAVAFVLLVSASLVALRAASGWPDERIYLTGESLRAWHGVESCRIQGRVRDAARLMVVGLLVLAVAVGTTWLGPAETKTGVPLLRLDTPSGPVCGALVGARDGQIVLTVPAGGKGNARVVPLAEIAHLTVVSAC
ncbi:hypothetical protein ACFYP0_07755 [Micromonospora arida]|uniref:hypothetical protein n=1 Tax=Micromonospora arida TaxID=2203715 RepID=UPI0036AAD1EB